MTAAFLGLEAALYAVFLTMDLTGGSGDPVKYASIAVCLVFSVLFACRGGSRLMPAAMALTLGADTFLLLLNDHYGAGVALYLLRRRKGMALCRFGGRGPGFWAACGLGGLFVIVGGLAALDFDRAFTVFHTIFFPGKDNWLFDPATDPVILILPEEFFRSCALLILAGLLLACGVLIAADLRRRRR